MLISYAYTKFHNYRTNRLGCGHIHTPLQANRKIHILELKDLGNTTCIPYMSESKKEINKNIYSQVWVYL